MNSSGLTTCSSRLTMKKLLLLILLLFLPGLVWAEQIKISGTTNTDDVKFAVGQGADRNYGIATTMAVANNSGILLRINNLGGLLPANATMISVVCSLYCITNSADGYLVFFRCLKSGWKEGIKNNAACVDSGATLNDWNCTANEWTTANCGSAADSVENTGDGVRPDRWATPAGDSVNVTTVNTWYGFSVGAALAQEWYAGTATGGVFLYTPYALSLGDNTFASSEYTTDATKIPFWTITYKAPNRRNNLIRKIIK